MEVFREMSVQSRSSEQIDALLSEVERKFPPGWARDRLLEAKYQSEISAPRRLICLNYDGDDNLAPATLLLFEDGHGELKLSSIMPRELNRLSIREANDLLEEFTRRFLEPCAKSLGIEVVLTDRDKDLSHWLSTGALSRFRRFSDGANRRAGYLLPIDRERWLEFVLTAHRDRSKLDAETLRRWLIEIEGWSPEVGDRLAAEYAFGGELLTFSDRYRAGA